MKDRCIGFLELRDMNLKWRDVRALGTRLCLGKGEFIAHDDMLYYLERGRVRLTHTTRDGKEKILWYIGEGCIFGETPFFDKLPSGSQSVHVCVTKCEIYAFSRDCVYNQLATQHPELLLDLLPSLARKVRMLSNHASSLYVDEVVIRVCKFLGQRLLTGSDPLRIKPDISRQDMASLLGVHRVTLFKALKQLEDSGVFAPYAADSFVVLQPDEFFRLMDY